MADNLAQGDDEIKNPVAQAETDVSAQASNSFLSEINDDLINSSSGSSSSEKTLTGSENAVRNGDGQIITRNDDGAFRSGGEKNSMPNGEKNSMPNGEKNSMPNGNIKETHPIGDNNDVKITDNGSRIIKDGSWNPFQKKDGVTELKTGDYLVRKDGAETLFTPNGDSVTVNKDGTMDVKGDVKEVKTEKNGETTITFKDGSTVKVDKEGIVSVSRDGKTESFPRLNKIQNHQEFPHPNPRPWPMPGGGGGGGGKGGGGSDHGSGGGGGGGKGGGGWEHGSGGGKGGGRSLPNLRIEN